MDINLVDMSKPLYRGFLMSGDVCIGEIRGTELFNITRPELLPLGLRRFFVDNCKSVYLDYWLDTRSVDRDRTNYRAMKTSLHLGTARSREDLIKHRAFTISDSYWIRHNNDDFTRYNQLISYNEEVYKLALQGKKLDREVQSPVVEMTTGGSFEKAWKLENGVWYLHKFGAANVGPGSALAEVFAYKLADRLGISCAEYNYVQGGRLVASKDITHNRNVNLEPLGTILDGDSLNVWDYEAAWDFLDKYNINKRDYLDMIFLDALISNFDRHIFNIGLFTNKVTGEVEGLSTIYDNNLGTTGVQWSIGVSTNINDMDCKLKYLKDNNYPVIDKLNFLCNSIGTISFTGNISDTSRGVITWKTYVIDESVKGLSPLQKAVIEDNIVRDTGDYNTLEVWLMEYLNVRIQRIREYYGR